MFCLVAQALSGCIYTAKLNGGREHSTAVGCWDLSLTLLNRLSSTVLPPKLSLGTVRVGQVPCPVGSLGAAILFWRAGEFKNRDTVGFSPESGPGH